MDIETSLHRIAIGVTEWALSIQDIAIESIDEERDRFVKIWNRDSNVVNVSRRQGMIVGHITSPQPREEHFWHRKRARCRRFSL